MDCSGVQNLKGSWDFVDGENFDEFMKEVGVGMMIRMIGRSIKPRLVISEENGEWTLRSESTIKTVICKFTPGEQFEETTPDGREVTSTITFEGNKWIHVSIDKNGKKSTFIRFVDEEGQQMIHMESGLVKARRWYKRVE